MQTIQHAKEYKHIHPIFHEFERLYTALSNNDVKSNSLFRNISSFDSVFKPLEDICNEYGNCEVHLNYLDKKYSKMPKMKYNKKNIIVAFSGGKDSVATALYYKYRGDNVYLYHVHGVNKLFPQELQSAEQIAKQLELPLIVENVSLIGNSLYPDHPLKNMVIANMMLQWGIVNNIGTRITFGNYYDGHLADACFETAGDDCVEMWDIYLDIMQRYIPQIKFELPLQNIQDAFEIVSQHEDILPAVLSCVGPNRYREYLHKNNERKYGIKLLPQRCGSCWKCAVEYIWLTDHAMQEYNASYYKHCLDLLKKNYKEETGDIPTPDELWSNYFFYDKKQSLYFTDK